MRLKGKNVLLTGASSGIGRQIAILFSKEGANVVAVARRKERLESLKKETEDFQGKVIPVEGDVTNNDDIEKMVSTALDQFKQIDILINNAGILDDFMPISEITDELWEKVLEVNLTAPMKLTRKVIKEMEKNGKGVILNTGSLAGVEGSRAGVAYTASKHGLIGFTKNIAFMYAEKNIRCNAIAPGGVNTEITNSKTFNDFGAKRVMSGTANNIRSADPIEIANIALFLVSDEASFVNGEILVADGGWSAY